MDPLTATPLADLRLVDHHCHSVTAATLDDAAFEALLSESGRPGPPGASNLDTLLGLAVRRWCAPLLDLPPGSPGGAYVRRRQELGADTVNQRLLDAAGLDALLVDTGYAPPAALDLDELAVAAAADTHEVVRLERVAEDALAAALRTGEATATEVLDGIDAHLDRRRHDAVAFKSIVAYRGGLAVDPRRPGRDETVAALDEWLGRERRSDRDPRLDHPVVIRHLLWTALDTGRPLQIHTGIGDRDSRLDRADPTLLSDLLDATAEGPSGIVLLHCYPFHRQAAHLARLYPHVHIDIGLAAPHVGARTEAVLTETLELAPFGKLLYSSDGYGLSELHLLGAVLFRQALDRVLSEVGRVHALDAGETRRISELIGRGNAERLYLR